MEDGRQARGHSQQRADGAAASTTQPDGSNRPRSRSTTRRNSRHARQSSEVSLTSPLYGLYKIGSTGAVAPSGSRPGLFSFERRALFDAWTATGVQLTGESDPPGVARSRYVSRAHALGWRSSAGDEAAPAPVASTSRSRGMKAVSTMTADEPEPVRSALHQLAVDGDAARLRDSSLDVRHVNDRDEHVRCFVGTSLIGQGFTALHLAADRGQSIGPIAADSPGHAAAVEALLDRGADPSLHDGDGNTALDLATFSEQDAVLAVLQARS